MNNPKLKALLSAIKQSYSYKQKQIEVEQEKDRLKVYSIGNSGEAFYSTEIVSLAIAMNVSSYLSYDNELNKVVLHLF